MHLATLLAVREAERETHLDIPPPPPELFDALDMLPTIHPAFARGLEIKGVEPVNPS